MVSSKNIIVPMKTRPTGIELNLSKLLQSPLVKSSKNIKHKMIKYILPKTNITVNAAPNLPLYF